MLYMSVTGEEEVEGGGVPLISRESAEIAQVKIIYKCNKTLADQQINQKTKYMFIVISK